MIAEVAFVYVLHAGVAAFLLVLIDENILEASCFIHIFRFIRSSAELQHVRTFDVLGSQRVAPFHRVLLQTIRVKLLWQLTLLIMQLKIF